MLCWLVVAATLFEIIILSSTAQCAIPDINGRSGTSLQLWTRNGTRNFTAPYLSGISFEDIAHSGDGGIYAELIRNRAFQGSGVTLGTADFPFPGKVITAAENPTLPFAPVLDGWSSVGPGASLSLDLLHPLSTSLQTCLQLDVALDATGEVGFRNDGWWGISVVPQTYNFSFYAQANSYRWNWTLTHFDASLRNSNTGQVYASVRVPAGGSNGLSTYGYTSYSGQLKNTETASTTNNSFFITVNAEELRGQTIYFDLISLFPETYKGRANGLRKDLAENLEAANFKFLRFPGGNNLEGYSISRRWKWWETIGSLTDRPGRPGNWGYYNTDGLGLLEYMYWCEDMDLVPVLVIYLGFSLDIAIDMPRNMTDANELPVSLMGPILQEALDELEYLTGDTSTPWGAKRAAHGHPEPFHIPYVELGNEDFFSHNYPERVAFMYEGLKAKYPNITYVYSAANLDPDPPTDFEITLPPGVLWDAHPYRDVKWFIDNFDFWDNFQRATNNLGVLGAVMEYNVQTIDPIENRLNFTSLPTKVDHPRMLSAVAEAVYALGWERNPDVVKLAAFGPVMQNSNAYKPIPYLQLFNANPNETVFSTSYYQEFLFNRYKGIQTLPVTTVEGDINPLFWVATIDEPANAIYLKIVNSGSAIQNLTVSVDALFDSLNGTILEPPASGDPHAINSLENKTAIYPKSISDLESHVWGDRTLKDWPVPAYSISVLQFNIFSTHGRTLLLNTTSSDERPVDISDSDRHDEL